MKYLKKAYPFQINSSQQLLQNANFGLISHPKKKKKKMEEVSSIYSITKCIYKEMIITEH